MMRYVRITETHLSAHHLFTDAVGRPPPDGDAWAGPLSPWAGPLSTWAGPLPVGGVSSWGDSAVSFRSAANQRVNAIIPVCVDCVVFLYVFCKLVITH